jgi:hypothetical protein
MKPKIFVLAMAIVLTLATVSAAKVWHVNNAPGIQADFLTPQAAHDSTEVQSGDTLYVYGSGVQYGDLTLTKTLHLIGPGYFLNENSDTQAHPTYAFLGITTFNSGSENSSVSGFQIWLVNVNASNICVNRNFVKNGVKVNNASDVLILQNCLAREDLGNPLVLSSNAQFCKIMNNIFPYNTYRGLVMDATSSATVLNNYLTGTLDIYNCSFHNNILDRVEIRGKDNAIITHNISSNTALPTENGNQSNVDMTTVFVGTGTTDGQWQLKEGSPAIGAGVDGVDCGPFGGDTPYVLSGLPPIPAIYQFKAPAIGSKVSGLPVTVKVKAHD